MPIRDFGAVCDISVLTDSKSLNKAQKFFNSSGLYIPNPTYSWLSRSKLIEVRHQAVKYSLINQRVRERKIYPTHLPELYDEISRQIMFNTNHNVALTDLRGLLLGAHLQLPVLTFDNELVKRISKEIGIQPIRSFEVHPNWLTIRDVLGLYRELLYASGKHFHEQLENGKNFPKTIKEIKESYTEHFKKTEKSIRKISRKQTNPGVLKFQYFAWDIMPSIEEYYEQNIVLPEIIQQICERCILLIAEPVETDDKKTSEEKIEEKQKSTPFN